MNTQLVVRARDFFRRHWRRAIRLREKLVVREEALHLGLAGIVGVLGGLVDLVFCNAIEDVTLFFFRRPGDPVEVAEMMPMWQCVVIPVLGGLAAGLVMQ